MSSFESLIAEHTALTLALDDFVMLLDPDFPRGIEAAARLRRFRDLLHDHLSREDASVYPMLARSSDLATSTIAESFANAFARLTQDWQAYLKTWPTAPQAADWPRFCQDSRAIASRLYQRIEDENALLYPTALKAGAISLRDPRLAA